MMGNRKSYHKVKMQDKIAARDGWRCNYCGETLVHSTTWNYVWDRVVEGDEDGILKYGSNEERRALQHLKERTGVGAQLDHKTPVASGGTNEIENLVLSCPRCNNKKSNRIPYRMMKWIFGGWRHAKA
jgi:hypothetical protein